MPLQPIICKLAIRRSAKFIKISIEHDKPEAG
jgi:hypothetical protein